MNIRLGDAGCLRCWNDPDGIALLEALGVGPVFEWRRDRETVWLAEPILGIAIGGATPEDLMDGVEYLAAAADNLLPLAGGSGPEEAAWGVARKLRRHFALRPASAPPNVEFTLAEYRHTAAVARPEAIRDALRQPEVEEHRPFGAAIKKSLGQPW